MATAGFERAKEKVIELGEQYFAFPNEGVFGNHVCKGRGTSNNLEVAIKILGGASNSSTQDIEASQKRAKCEAEIHQCIIDNRIHHDNIVKVLNVFIVKETVYIVMELAPLGNLDEYFKKHSELCTNTMNILQIKVKWMKDILSGLVYLHSKFMIHRDLKPDNIVISGAKIAKICDFGLLKVLDSDHGESSDHELMTSLKFRFFQAPEFFKDVVRYGLKSDVYSMGLICTAMIQALPHRTLLPAAESLDYLTTIGLEALSKPDLQVLICSDKDPGLLSELKQVINTMLHVSPDNRTSSAEALPRMESLLKNFDDLELQETAQMCAQ